VLPPPPPRGGGSVVWDVCVHTVLVNVLCSGSQCERLERKTWARQSCSSTESRIGGRCHTAGLIRSLGACDRAIQRHSYIKTVRIKISTVDAKLDQSRGSVACDWNKENQDKLQGKTTCRHIRKSKKGFKKISCWAAGVTSFSLTISRTVTRTGFLKVILWRWWHAPFRYI
jgi:hypothetical protein